MYLDLNGENEAALKLYQSLGYEEEGRLKNEIKIGGHYTDLIIMGRFLQ
jgi:RimJ/RimL family protein N-acetyltransferase